MPRVPGQLHHAITVTATCLLALLGVGRCPAADSGVGGSLVATTDYVFRGLSQTRGDPALQGDVHYRGAAGWFAGAWASTIDPGAEYIGDIEMNVYAGWTWAPTPDWSARVSYVRYLYPEASQGADYDYGELAGTVGYRDRFFATLGWSPDMVRTTQAGYDQRGAALSYELSLRQPVWRWFGVAAGVGYYDLTDVLDDSYWSWNATFTAAFGNLELNLARFANDAAARALFGRDTAADRWALTAIWRF
jgi:uncharacterized protein (TIGR02001 family)